MEFNEKLGASRLEMLGTLSGSSETSENGTFSDAFVSGGKLLIKGIEEVEENLSSCSSSVSTLEIGSRIESWQSSLEPWHELLKSLKNFGTIPRASVSKLLDSLPAVIQTIFGHCKKSESLYAAKFGDIRSHLTSLYRQTDALVQLFFSILESNVDYHDQMPQSKHILQLALEKIGDIASIANRIDLKILINTWKVFAKLAAMNESLVKKLAMTESVNGRYIDIAQDIRTILSTSLQENKETNYLKIAKCVSLLLKILGRLCTIYQGYCGEKVCSVLVEMLASLYEYSSACNSSKISEYSECHIFPAAFDLLNVLIDEKDFPRAFLECGKSKSVKPIYYHLLTLRVIVQLIKGSKKNVDPWFQEESNLIEVVLANVNGCCSDLLIDQIRIQSILTTKSGIYEATFELVSLFLSQLSAQHFPAVETALVRHLLAGEFWSCLLSSDCWTYLARICRAEVRYEHLSFLIKIQSGLTPRENSLEFEIVGNLIRRLYKTLPKEIQGSLYKEVAESLSDVRVIETLGESLAGEDKVLEGISGELVRAFKETRLTPSVQNWSCLVGIFNNCLLKSIGRGGRLSKQERLTCANVIRDVWSFLASSLSKSEGITLEILLEFTNVLLDITQPDSSDNNSSNDRLVASIYKSMVSIVDNLPASHRIKINVFVRKNLEPFLNESGTHSLLALTEVFSRLIDDEDPWVRQETFETYTEYVVKSSSPQLFDALSIGINKSSRACRHMQLYLSNKQIYHLSRHSSLDTYLRRLSDLLFGNSALFHKCYEPDFRQRDEKMPRLQLENIDQRVEHVCTQIRYLIDRKDELSDASIDKLRTTLLQLLQPNTRDST